ncbi:MAG: hypothetical protein E7233_08845 [Lachnospiraceae bacterium]|nr:hypothetical protein [Lachnospiraceae bacterium]
MAGKKRMTKAQRRRRRKMLVIAKLSAAGLVLIGVIVLVIVLISSCSKKNAGKAKEAESQSIAAEQESSSLAEAQAAALTHETTAAPKKYSDAEYAAAKVNEMGSVPILMYHRIYDMKNSETDYIGGNVDADGYNRTSEAFEADLEQYYEWGYRCVRLDDYLDGNVNVEFGCSPVIITFDDGDRDAVINGFDANGDPIFTDECALSVLERVKERHPDFNVTATFFLNDSLFRNGREKDEQLMHWMIDHGYDIGNHTKDHPNLSELTGAEIEEQVGFVYNLLDEIIPGEYVNIVALPYGIPVDTSADSKYDMLFAGTYEGKSYTTKATLLCSWTFEDSIFSGNVDKTYIRRIRGYDNGGEDWDIEYNFSILNNGYRYISDGNPDTVVVPDTEIEPGAPDGREVIIYKTE